MRAWGGGAGARAGDSSDSGGGTMLKPQPGASWRTRRGGPNARGSGRPSSCFTCRRARASAHAAAHRRAGRGRSAAGACTRAPCLSSSGMPLSRSEWPACGRYTWRRIYALARLRAGQARPAPAVGAARRRGAHGGGRGRAGAPGRARWAPARRPGGRGPAARWWGSPRPASRPAGAPTRPGSAAPAAPRGASAAPAHPRSQGAAVRARAPCLHDARSEQCQLSARTRRNCHLIHLAPSIPVKQCCASSAQRRHPLSPIVQAREAARRPRHARPPRQGGRPARLAAAGRVAELGGHLEAGPAEHAVLGQQVQPAGAASHASAQASAPGRAGCGAAGPSTPAVREAASMRRSAGPALQSCMAQNAHPRRQDSVCRARQGRAQGRQRPRPARRRPSAPRPHRCAMVPSAAKWMPMRTRGPRKASRPSAPRSSRHAGRRSTARGQRVSSRRYCARGPRAARRTAIAGRTVRARAQACHLPGCTAHSRTAVRRRSSLAPGCRQRVSAYQHALPESAWHGLRGPTARPAPRIRRRAARRAAPAPPWRTRRPARRS